MGFLEPFCNFFAFSIRKKVGGSNTFILPFLFTCSPLMASWKIDKIKTGSSQYNSTRFLYTEKAARLELYKTASEWVGCFSVTSLPISGLAEDPSKSRITLIVDSQEKEILAHRVAGGQKLVLPEDAIRAIFDAMKMDSSITLKTGRYMLVIPPHPSTL